MSVVSPPNLNSGTDHLDQQRDYTNQTLLVTLKLRVSGDATLPSQNSTQRTSRSEYDPRLIKFRNAKPLQDLELDRLADITWATVDYSCILQ